MTGTRWLNEPGAEVRDRVPHKLPFLPPAASEEAVEAVTAGENGDELVVIPPQLSVLHIYTMMSLKTVPKIPRLRAEVVVRLLEAQDALPDGFTWTLLDGWRTREFQAELLAHYREATDEPLDLYVSDPASAVLMPPHTTGGAIDLTVAVDGVPLALGTDYDSFHDAAHVRALDDLDDDDDEQRVLDRDLRRLMGHALIGAGFAPYPLEWWHWSYGDQRWAAFVERDQTLYSPIS